MTNTTGRIMWLAVATGYVVDYVLSTLIFLIGGYFDSGLARGLSFNTAASTTTAILLVLSTGFGGWLAGRIAKHERLLHGALVGGVGIIIMLLESLFGSNPALINIVLQCVAVFVGALGGLLSQRLPTPQQ